MFTFHEFFAGAGLVRLGLGQSWKCVWANDIDPRKADVYRANFGADEFQIGDVADVKTQSLPIPVDMAWASFPCQDLSLAGWRGGMAARRSGTFWAFWRIQRDLFDQRRRPPLIVLENVTGLLYGGHFAGLCEALTSLGMQFGALVIDARWFLPQSRPRVFIVAVDSRINCEPFTQATSQDAVWFPKAVTDAYASLSPAVADSWRWWKLPLPPATTPKIDSLIEDEPHGVSWHTEQETEQLLHQMTPINYAKVQRALTKKERTVGLIYKRTRNGVPRPEVRFDGIAGCLRTPEGGSSRQIVLVAENGKARSRLLSPREAARLMGAPDSYLLPPKYNDAYRAMGDGVAVPAISWLSDHLLTPLAAACRSAHEVRASFYSTEEHARFAASRRIAEALAARWETK